MTDVKIVEGLCVGPDDVLLLKISGDWSQTQMSELLDELVQIGLTHRALVIAGDVEMCVVSKAERAKDENLGDLRNPRIPR